MPHFLLRVTESSCRIASAVLRATTLPGPPRHSTAATSLPRVSAHTHTHRCCRQHPIPRLRRSPTARRRPPLSAHLKIQASALVPYSCLRSHRRIGTFHKSKASTNSVYFAMDGQRPMEELSEARNLEKVLGFRDAREGDREFAVEEIIDRTGTTLTTVLRSPSDDDVRI